jgi:RimJ/RimL family protein N-acetyltransferase
LTVALFNERALHVYKKCGFKPLKTFSMTWAGIEKEYLGMGLQLPIHKGGELS